MVFKIAGIMKKVSRAGKTTYEFVKGVSIMTKITAKTGVLMAESYGFVAGMNTIGSAVHGDIRGVFTGFLPSSIGGDITSKDFVHSMLMLGGMKVAGKVFGEVSQLAKSNFQPRIIKPGATIKFKDLTILEKAKFSVGKSTGVLSSTAAEGFGMHTGQWAASFVGDESYDFLSVERLLGSMIDAASFKIGHKIATGTRMSSATSKVGKSVGEFIARTEMGKKLTTKVRITEINNNIKLLEITYFEKEIINKILTLNLL